MKVLHECQREISNLFEKFIGLQVNRIQETKITHIKRIGVLDHVKKLILFVDKMESMWAKDSGIANRAYQELIRAVFRFINNTADLALTSAPLNKTVIAKKAIEHHTTGLGAYSKKPRQIIGKIIRFENYHHIYFNLEPRQVPYLELHIEEARKLYEEALQDYVKELAQLQFSELMTFFDGVDAIYKGMKEPSEYETIQYEDKYSNRILSKLIKRFPLASIEKGMTIEYKKLHKNLSPEEELLTTVWAELKDFMIKKYEHFEFLVSQCYKNQRLAFTSNDLITSFLHAETKYLRSMTKKMPNVTEVDYDKETHTTITEDSD